MGRTGKNVVSNTLFKMVIAAVRLVVTSFKLKKLATFAMLRICSDSLISETRFKQAPAQISPLK